MECHLPNAEAWDLPLGSLSRLAPRNFYFIEPAEGIGAWLSQNSPAEESYGGSQPPIPPVLGSLHRRTFPTPRGQVIRLFHYPTKQEG